MVVGNQGIPPAILATWEDNVNPVISTQLGVRIPTPLQLNTPVDYVLTL